MEAFVTAAAGFLLAVLWFDLMHDVLVRGRMGELPPENLETISRYYRRATTDAHPMGRMVLVAMLATLVASVAEIVRGDGFVVVAGSISAALVLGAMVLVGSRTFPNAVTVGKAQQPPLELSRLARAVYRDHVVCLVGMSAVIALQLVSAAS